MRKELPAGVLEMLTIPGLRPDKVLKLYQELGVSSVAELWEAAREGRLQKIKGLGASLQNRILRGIEIQREAQGRRHMHRAAELLKAAEKHLREARPDIIYVTAAGDFRRGCELVGDLSLVAEVRKLPSGPQTIATGGQLKTHLTDAAHYGVTLLLATGSDAHLASLRALAAERKMSLDENGLRRGGKLIAAASEDSIYKALGMQPVPPELREGRDEVARALAGTLPELVTDEDIAGILHAHTDRSDGLDTLETMAEATLSRGYEYFGVADHSRSAHYAGGLSPEEVAEQQAEADRLNKKYGKRFRIFKGVESDILVDGSLDYPEEVLETFDFVVASVHGRFKMDRAAQTERIIRAVSNPYTTILGHMTGRQLLRRPGYDIDIEKVLAACAEHGVAVEINSNPWRLDLDWRWHESALKPRLPDEHQPRRPFHARARSHALGRRDGPQGRSAKGQGSQLSQQRRACLVPGEESRPSGGSNPFRFIAEALVRGLPPPPQKSGPHRVRTEKWLSANVSGPPSDGRN